MKEPEFLNAEGEAGDKRTCCSMAADRLLTIRQLASMTGLKTSSLYHFVSQGRIPVVRVSRRCIRFRYSDLLSWIDELTEKPNKH